jgi:D-amino-acid dehydrogenase
MSCERRVVIVGAGAVGLCCAFAVAGRGFHVTVLDASSGAAGSCSHGNAGMIVPSHFTPLAAPGTLAPGLKWLCRRDAPLGVRWRWSADLFEWFFRFWRTATTGCPGQAAPLLRDLHMASRQLFSRWNAAWNRPMHWSPHGLLMLCRTPRAFEEEIQLARRCTALGLDAEVLDPAALARIEPRVHPEVKGAVLHRHDAHLDPGKFMAALEEECIARGVDILHQTRAAGFVIEQSRISRVKTSSGEMHADEVVLAAGSATPPLARALGLHLPMLPGRGYSLTAPQPGPPLRHCALLAEARVAVTPLDGALRIAGGLELGAREQDPVCKPRLDAIRCAPTRYYTGFEPAQFAAHRPWTGLRPCPPDGLPYIGRSRAGENLCVASGHAMMGLSLAPITGEIVARLLAAEVPGFDIRLLSPDRFT